MPTRGLIPRRGITPATPEGRETRIVIDSLRRDIAKALTEGDASVAGEAATNLAAAIEAVIALIPVPADTTPESTYYGSGDPGALATYSRADHDHELNEHASGHLPDSIVDPLAVGTPVTISDSSNSEGDDNSFSRNDHVHAHGDRGGGTLHATVVSGGAAGFMSGSDKAKLDSFPSNTSLVLYVPPGFANTAAASTKAMTSTRSFAVYMGISKQSHASVVCIFRTTVAAATVTWCEVAIATGAPVSSGNPTLTVLAYTDATTPMTAAAGIKNVTVTVSLPAGVHWWVIYGNQATTAATMRACSSGDDILAGHQCLVVSQPSAILNTPTAFTQEGNTVLPMWTAAHAT